MTEETQPKTDFYLKLAAETDQRSVLDEFYRQDYTTEVNPETGEETQVPSGDPYLVAYTEAYGIDVVGTIYKPTGNTVVDAEGNEVPEMAPIDGWHVNLRLVGDARRKDVEALSKYFTDPEPRTPSRVWL